MYTPPNEYEPRVPASLIRTVVNKMKKEENSYLMLDLNYVTPMTASFVPSTVNFVNLSLPSALKINELEII